MIPALAEAQGLYGQARRTVVMMGALVIAIAAWIVVGATPAYSSDRQQRFTVEHVTIFPSGKSFWSILTDGAPLPPSYARFGKWHFGKLPSSDRERWFTPAPPMTGLQPPAIAPIEVLQSGSERRIRLRLRANGATRILIVLPADARLQAAGVAGFVRRIASDESSGKYALACVGRSCDGVELVIDAATSKPIPVLLTGSSNGLPAAASPLLQGRPANARPQYTPNETITAVRVNL